MKQKANILLYDLETGPNLGWVWGKYDQTVMKFEQEWQLLSFAFKWLNERKTVAVGGNLFTEEEMVNQLWDLFDKADIVIAHNGDKFDQRMINAKFMEFNLNPPSPYRTVDTLKVARRYFRFTSNKLDDIGQKFKVGKKAETGGFETWLACMQGDRKAWHKMLKYNKQDVILLEKIYLKLLPWIDNHPPVNIIAGRPEACPKCGSGPMQRRGTRKVNKTTTVQRYQCQNCGGWSTDRRSQKSDVLFTN